jgi:hypothetical protein
MQQSRRVASSEFPLRCTGAARSRIAIWIALGLALAPAPASAQTPVPVGGEFQINTYTTSTQASASVAAEAGGDFTVAWQGSGSAGTDTSLDSIQAQRLPEPFVMTGVAVGVALLRVLRRSRRYIQ